MIFLCIFFCLKMYRILAILKYWSWGRKDSFQELKGVPWRISTLDWGSQILIIGVWELKESEGGEAPPADLSQWTPGCEQWEGSLLAILWSILSLTRTFYSLLVMWTLSMSAQITGQHFSPRSQWLGSTCKNVLKYYELREACFLWRWVSV